MLLTSVGHQTLFHSGVRRGRKAPSAAGQGGTLGHKSIAGQRGNGALGSESGPGDTSSCEASLCEACLLFSLKVGPSSWVCKG